MVTTATPSPPTSITNLPFAPLPIIRPCYSSLSLSLSLLLSARKNSVEYYWLFSVFKRLSSADEARIRVTQKTILRVKIQKTVKIIHKFVY